MPTLTIPVVKGKGTVDFDTEALPQEVYVEALRLGLKELVNRGMSKITVAKLEGEDLAKAQAAAMEVAQKNVAKINAGDIRYTGAAKSKSTLPREVQTEAMRIARNVIKDAIKAAKGKISHYKASEITAAAKEVLKGEQGPAIIKTAEANLAARKAPEAIDLSALVSGMKEDPELVAKAEAKKKKDTLSAAQAGKVVKRAKPAAQPTAH